MRRRIGRRAWVVFSGAWLVATAWAGAAGAAQAKPAREDLAAHKPATASTFQGDDKWPGAAVDENPETRWCAADGSVPQWLRVDLGRPESVTGFAIAWESANASYRFQVEGSADGRTWNRLHDTADIFLPAREAQIQFASPTGGTRHVRLTVNGASDGQWASLFGFQVFGTRPAVAASSKTSGPKKVDDKSVLKDIKAPAGFDVTVFAAPPDVSYPTCLAAAPTGEVYVGIDENGSLDAKANRGRVVRCVDGDGDGRADSFNVFASMDSPRGVVWDAGTLYVLHPPLLSAFRDTDSDGKADRSDVLVKGIGFDLKFRGADHTTNGIRLGIDGYLYVAVGDYGFIRAEGADGATHQLLGGGVARVRTDGSGLEIVSRGQRNIYDVAIDPRLNLFTRDNTNDGDGWDVRLSHVVPTGHYGYPSLFKRFGDEILPPLADYGGGSPCGSLYLQEPGFPGPFGDALYTCEWGRGAIFMHPLEAQGAGFKAGQTTFVTIPRPTDIDVDGSGRIYVSSWRDGGFTFSKPEVGYLIRVTAQGNKPAPFPNIKGASDDQLVGFLSAPGAVLRLAAQRELLHRGIKPAVARALSALAASDKPIPGRVAAIFALEQGLGLRSREALVSLAKSAPAVREFALKALADRREDAASVDPKAVAAYVGDPDPRVRLQAVVALGRLGQVAAAPAVLPMTADQDPIVAHVAVKALVTLKAADACLLALDNPAFAPGASKALQEMHDPKVVAGLARVVAADPRSVPGRRAALGALCRLYFAESPYEGQWWGTRPDTTGPYYRPTTWPGTAAAGLALQAALKKSDEATGRWLLGEMLRNKIDLEETTTQALGLAAKDPALRSAVVDLFAVRDKLSLDRIRFLEGVATDDPDAPTRAKAIRGLLRHQNQQEARESALRGLASVAGADDPPSDVVAAWADYAKDGRHNRDVGTFARMAEGSSDAGRSALGFGVLIQVEANNKAPEASRVEARRAIERAWARPESAARLLKAVGLARANAYAPKVRDLLADGRPEVRDAAGSAARRLNITARAEGATRPATVKPIAATPYDQVLAAAIKDPGDAALGAQLFEKQRCVNCHSVAKSQPIKGPYLGDVAARYSRAELVESILKPSAKIAQGFETQKLALSSGQVYEGFVVREAGDEIELRNSAGAVTIVPKKDIEERGKSDLSVMPQGLLDPLTPRDLASILAYLDSLKGK